MADDTRERVLSAAGLIFARQGFEGATVREICASANVNLASVNYHFGSKKTLYLETVKLAHQQKLKDAPLPALREDASREEKLFGFIRTILNRLLGGGDGGWQTELLIREMIRPTHACKSLVEDYIRPQSELLLEIIDEFVPAEASQAERQRLAYSVVGQCLHYRVARGFVTLLAGRQADPSLFDIDTLAAHIARFSMAALTHWNAEDGTLRTTAGDRRGSQRAKSTARRETISTNPS